jgi:ribosomal protein L9
MKEKNIAVRVTWQTWQALEQVRSNLEAQKKKKTTLSEVVREVLEDHSGTNGKEKHSDS